MRPVCRVLAGAGDGELAFALQELEGVARLLGSLLLDDGKDMVLEVGLAQVVEALAGHGGVLDALFLREHARARLP